MIAKSIFRTYFYEKNTLCDKKTLQADYVSRFWVSTDLGNLNEPWAMPSVDFSCLSLFEPRTHLQISL